MKKIIALILALLMAAAVIPAYAKPAAEDTAAAYDMAAEDISAYGEAVRYPIVDDYKLKPTLGQAAGCEGDRFCLDFLNADEDQPWSIYMDQDSDYRWIAHAYVPEGGTFDSEMTASYLAMAGTHALTFDYWLGTDSDAKIEIKVTMNGTTTVVFSKNGEGYGSTPEWKQGMCSYDVASDNTTVTVSVGYMGTVAYGKGETKDSSYGDPSKNLYLRNFYLQQGLDGALNAPDFFAHYTYSDPNDFLVYPVEDWNRVTLVFMPN
ncbi:MAG: hypothetical protein IKX58_03630, partial [Clostridia bacterium]|nr:hypothetical protein [Clostridia bacterium]